MKIKIHQSPEAKKYLDQALNFIFENSIQKDVADFKRLREIGYSIAADAKKPSDCYEAIQCVLANLGDHHSKFETPEQAKAYDHSDNVKVIMPAGMVINNNIGYITVPGFLSFNRTLEQQFADSMQNLIRSVDSKDIIGWIVDARNNSGGNAAPMLIGIGPILGEGFTQFGVDAKGKRDSGGYSNGTLTGGEKGLRVSSPYRLINPDPYVAVLTGNSTGSSGEAVILAFKNRHKTRSFGAPTFGNATGNFSYYLSDGAVIDLTAIAPTDRFGKMYKGKIQPDVLIDDDEKTENDEVINAAVKWLKEKK